MANLFKDAFKGVTDIFTGGRTAARDARNAARDAESRAFERFKELRDLQSSGFAEALGRVSADTNPFISQLGQLEPEFRQAGTSAAFGGVAPTAAAALHSARLAGGGRGGAFSLGSAALAGRFGQQAGLDLAGLLSQNRLSSLQNIGQLRQFQAGLEEQAIGRRFGLDAQQLGLQGALTQSQLTGTTAAGIAGVQGASNILAGGLALLPKTITSIFGAGGPAATPAAQG